ncbi:ABC-2 type transport system permease protein [Algoriphagus sp. 4150]|uniref:DUF3526 domain-containing protein n=1 Tax=Algoriphagus sp. 4150 TaxID=2817756 RepID=UPI0028610703|nr:DUF3526 domain-containing protein [Algoriphagus sp. 4150]MDR7130281.1 ABC-2 type transport system permease protein [Algoriphagus sp. 4150]
MYRLMFKQFFRSNVVILCLLLVSVLGMTGILIGKQFLDRQERAAEQVTLYQQEHIERNVNFHQEEFGLLMYYLKFALINKPEKMAGLSIGQSDVNPAIQHVTIRNLEGQKYDTDLVNPSSLQSGNLDLGFVIIYLLPLLIIVFTFNLLSEEREVGTWQLVSIQSRSKLKYLLAKLSVRVLVILALFVLLLTAAKLVLGIPLDAAFFAFFLLGFCYIIFWFTVCFLVVVFQKNSSLNALTMLSLWLVLAILLPASINSYVSNRYPVPEALATMIEQRDGYHKKWDSDKRETMADFYAHYPQFEDYGMPEEEEEEEEFTWLWYYAMQQMGDDEAREESDAMRAKLEQRGKVSRSIAWAIPTMHVQLAFNNLAGTGSTNHMEFLDKTNEFHEKMRLHFYPRIFDNASVLEENWEKFEPEFMEKENAVEWFRLLLPVIICSGLLLFLTFLKLTLSKQKGQW